MHRLAGFVLVGGTMPQMSQPPNAGFFFYYYVGQWIAPAWTSDIGAMSFVYPMPVQAPRSTAACSLPDGTTLVCTDTGMMHLLWPAQAPGWPPVYAMPAFTGTVDALAQRGNQFVVGGEFTAVGGAATRIALWDSVSGWTLLGSGIDGRVRALAVTPGGDVVAGGDFTVVGGMAAARIARWNGTTWSSLGGGLDGPVHSLLVLPDGDVLAGGQFTLAGGVPAANLARWNGTSWSAVGAGTSGPVFAMARTPSGTIWIGGSFAFAGGAPSDNIAALVPAQPASAQSQGGGCSGSAGPDLLAATELPWLGGTYRARATGLPDGLAVSLLGRVPISVPLPALLPVGVPGCTLLVDAIHLDLGLATGGSVAFAYAVPDVPLLLGDVWYHQVITGEIDAAGGLVAVTASDRLRLAIGDL